VSITAEALAINIGALQHPATTCSSTTPLARQARARSAVRYATPATQPVLPAVGAITLSNNGTGTAAGVSGLALGGTMTHC